MRQLTGLNYDVNEELPQVTDPEQPDDSEFETWLDSLNKRTENGGADRLSRLTRKQLYFSTLKANGWTPKPKPTPLRPFWQTILKAWATIRCSRLRSLPLHRRLLCLVFFAPGRYYLTAAIIGLLFFGSRLSAPAPIPVIAATEQPRQFADTDKPETKHNTIIQKWDKPITITFSNCRENQKHHISCQYKDSTGQLRWLCIMGLSEADMK